jgi:CBS-domain-containing membrane protein
MKLALKNIAEELRLYWKNYVLQSLAAAISIFVLFLILTTEDVVFIASIGATAFIIFAMPESITAKPRNVIGGHLTGIIVGSFSILIPHQQTLASIAIYSLAVGVSIFIMVVIDTEHPPAAGTALGIAIGGFSLNVTAILILSALALSLIHHFFRPYLKDLV